MFMTPKNTLQDAHKCVLRAFFLEVDILFKRLKKGLK